MKIIRKINTSAAFAIDSKGREIIVIGKGIGFPKVPYELTDLSVIDRTFYDVDSRYAELIATLPHAFLLAGAAIAEQAEIGLECRLNPNLPVILADHLTFANERLQKKIDLTAPIAYDIRHLYSKEIALGDKALVMVKEMTGIVFPSSEAINIAMHLINAEAEVKDINGIMQSLQIIDEVGRVLEKELHIELDRESYAYSRFVIHIRYLLQRLVRGEQIEESGINLLGNIVREYPEAYECALKIARYLETEYGWICNKEEVLYLIIHIVRVQGKNT